MALGSTLQAALAQADAVDDEMPPVKARAIRILEEGEDWVYKCLKDFGFAIIAAIEVVQHRGQHHNALDVAYLKSIRIALLPRTPFVVASPAAIPVPTV